MLRILRFLSLRPMASHARRPVALPVLHPAPDCLSVYYVRVCGRVRLLCAVMYQSGHIGYVCVSFCIHVCAVSSVIAWVLRGSSGRILRVA